MAQGNAAQLSAYCVTCVCDMVALRSDLAAMVDPGDGRKQWIRNRHVPKVAAEDRRLDHLLEAMPGWAPLSVIAGEKVFVLIEALRTSSAAAAALEDLMTVLLDFELLGRPTCGRKLPFHTRIFVYALKFPLSDIFCLLANCLCECVARPCPIQLMDPKIQCLSQLWNSIFGFLVPAEQRKLSARVARAMFLVYIYIYQ